MLARVDELAMLRERVDELEQLLGLTALSPYRRPRACPPPAWQLLGMLVTRPSVSRNAAYDALFGARPECEQPEPKIVEVHLTRVRAYLREAFPGVVVKCVWGEGRWYMSAEDAARVRRGLGLAAQREDAA